MLDIAPSAELTTIRWQPGAPAVVVKEIQPHQVGHYVPGLYVRLDDGSIIAEYTPDELAKSLEVADVCELAILQIGDKKSHLHKFF
jgi:hypothetical protein